MTDERKTAWNGNSTLEAVRQRIDGAIALAERTGQRSTKMKASVAAVIAALRDALSRRQKHSVRLQRELDYLLWYTKRRDKAVFRRIAVRALLLKLAIAYYRYRWFVLKLVSATILAFVLIRYWDQIVAVGYAIIDWLRQEVRYYLGGNLTGDQSGGARQA